MEKEYKQQVAEGRVSDELKFSYAWHLIKSSYKNDIRKGIRLMEGEQNGVNRVQGRECFYTCIYHKLVDMLMKHNSMPVYMNSLCKDGLPFTGFSTDGTIT